MPSKYAVIKKDGYQTIELRNWDGIYYWSYETIYGKQWRKVPDSAIPFVEANVIIYKGKWCDTLLECYGKEL